MTQQDTIENNTVRRVIVVDDNPATRLSMINYLMLEGFTVTGVDSAHEFYLQVFAEPYAVAIIDSDLSDQNGLIVAEYTKKNTVMRVITLSEPRSSSTVLDNIKAGADINLVKPVNFQLLAACVNTLCSRINLLNYTHH